ncbi:ATP-binding cassette domain-containing protein [Pontibacillus yanchengensis]|uniref:ATP-binding cassette domain-containing protein n=2 Tax=Pontibacillus yanchengensis TaxID=462910 RepID=A0ACC7VLD3_9BACI|nr:ATP-binding cassette domain-containing protein [Pontibacillus yanchengensis]MYL54989.1 ATP-binding cassette domain-containing protein [Pontibacillus yanchengensis]
MKAVEMNDLTKYYKKSKGIENVSLSIDVGEIFGFIGPNGAGKSTAIRTLLNFIHPTSGTATIFGKDIVSDSKEIKELVGYLPSEVHYYDDMKALDLLQYSAKFHEYKNIKRIHQLAERLQLDLHKKIEDLSFGNRKKVGIIQALLHEPKLLILDEPTGGLDPLMQNIFFELLTEERKKGATIFFSSHILSEVQKMCDRVAIIKEGKLVTVEKVETLIKNNLKKVRLMIGDNQEPELELEGVLNKAKNGDHIAFLYSGEMNSLLNHLTALDIKDLLIQEPSLEEVFMHYYE